MLQLAGTACLAAHAARAASVAACRALRGTTHLSPSCAPFEAAEPFPPRAVAPSRGPRCPCTLAGRCALRKRGRPGQLRQEACAERQRLIHGLGGPPSGGEGRCDASASKMRCGPKAK
jgi:hypothetical protein